MLVSLFAGTIRMFPDHAAPIDQETPTPLYFRIKRWIESEITAGTYPVGAQLPPEPELCKHFNVSRITVRKSLQMLTQEGIIWRSRGKGSFVKKVPAARPSAPHIARPPQLRLAISIPFDKVWESERTQTLWKQNFPRITWQIGHRAAPPVRRLEEFAEETDIFALDDPARMRAVEEAGITLPWTEIAPEGRWAKRKQALQPGLADLFGERLETFFPQVFSPLVLFYNREDFANASLAAPPPDWSYQKFVDVACRLRDHFEASGRNDRIPFLAELSSPRRWPLFIYMEGGRLWDAATGRSCLDHPDTIRGLHHYHDLINNYRVSRNIFAADLPVDQNLFRRKLVSMHFGSYYTLGEYARTPDLPWGVAPAPRGSANRTMMAFGAFAVSNRTRERSLCWDFLEFMHSPEVQEIYLEEGRQIPTSQVAIRNWRQRCLPEQRETLDLFLQSVPRLQPPECPPSLAAHEKLLELIHLVWFDLTRLEEVCRQLAAELNHDVSPTCP
jgi:multiple sugar transport system substrate-binding protein